MVGWARVRRLKDDVLKTSAFSLRLFSLVLLVVLFSHVSREALNYSYTGHRPLVLVVSKVCARGYGA
mgnify:CR=1 FL=1